MFKEEDLFEALVEDNRFIVEKINSTFTATLCIEKNNNQHKYLNFLA